MSRKLLIIVAMVAISIFYLSGCKKSSSNLESSEEVVKTVAEYQADAKKEINKENMADELDKIQKSLEQELGEEE